MPSSPTIALRALFDAHYNQVSSEVERLLAEVRQSARGELADQLNQAVRRLRLAPDREELGATLVDAASSFAAGAALFRIEGDRGVLERLRGSDASLDSFPLVDAAAVRAAVETRDPVIAAASPPEIPAVLAGLFTPSGGRVAIYPLIDGDDVPAVLILPDAENTAVLELLTQTASTVWTALAPPPEPEPVVAMPPPGPQLVQLTPPPRRPAPDWETLSAEEQKLHLQAQRFARVQASDIRLREADAVQAGRARGEIYQALRERIDSARNAFRRDYFSVCPSMVDYLHVELVRTLAQNHAELLGKDYPGPLV